MSSGWWLAVIRARTASTTRAQRNLNAFGLSGCRHGVDVVLALVVDGASIEFSTAIVRDSAIGSDAEIGRWGSTNITLELRCRRGQNTTTTLGVREATVAQAVASGRIAAANAVLAITELA